MPVQKSQSSFIPVKQLLKFLHESLYNGHGPTGDAILQIRPQSILKVFK